MYIVTGQMLYYLSMFTYSHLVVYDELFWVEGNDIHHPIICSCFAPSLMKYNVIIVIAS